MILKLMVIHLFLGNAVFLLFFIIKQRFIKEIDKAMMVVDLHHQKNNPNNIGNQNNTRREQLNLLNKENITFKEIVLAYISFIMITWMICISFVLSSKFILLINKDIRKLIKEKEDKNEKS